jgi:hypothetical protein
MPAIDSQPERQTHQATSHLHHTSIMHLGHKLQDIQHTKMEGGRPRSEAVTQGKAVVRREFDSGALTKTVQSMHHQ